MSPADQPERILNQERGSALLIMLTIIGIGAAFLLVSALNKANQKIERDKITSAALAQAKEALIGDAASQSTVNLSGVLRLPDLGFGPITTTLSEGNAAPNFTGNTKDFSVIGKIPWKNLGISALRDGQGECLWYVVSGRFKKTPPTDVLNWDTQGQIDVIDVNGNAIANNVIALVVSPGRIIDGQDHASSDPVYRQCGGNYDARNYLDSFDVNDAISGEVNYFTGSTNNRVALNANNKRFVMAANDHYNDRFLMITAEDLFRPIVRRSDFALQINNFLDDASFRAHLQTVALTGQKGTDSVNCNIIASTENKTFCNNWKEMLLLTQLPVPAPITIDGSPTAACSRILIFGGQKSNAQVRQTALNKTAPANYLEGTNVAAFATPIAASSNFIGATSFNKASTSTDLVRCITGLAAVPTQKSFAADFTSFVTAGVGLTTNATDKTITVAEATGSSGGCFWFPDTIQLAGKITRAYYDYQFSFADTHALTGTGSDRGNGFTFQMVRSDIGSPTGICGREADMGALDSGDPWGLKSLIIETDVRRDNANTDPVANHTAIMAYGNLLHSTLNGNTTAACNGTAAGCRHNPANKFEESPTPLAHNQRLEIHTGCNSTCATCDPTNHVALNTYARITAWVDCTDCDDITVDLNRTAKTPTINRCFNLDPELNSVYFTFTGGFRSGTTTRQGVIIQNFQLHSE